MKKEVFLHNKIYFFIKKAILISGISATLLIPFPTQAGIPVTDFGGIAQIVKQTAENARMFTQTIQTYANMVKNDIFLAGNQMQADVNRSMMEISKITQSQTDIYNSEIARDLTPEVDAACLVETVSATMRESECFVEGEVSSKMSSNVSKRIPLAGKEYGVAGNTQQTPQEYKREVYSEMTELDKTGEGRLYARADLFNVDVLGDKEAKALDLQIKILQGPPDEKFAVRDYNTQAYKAEFVSRTRKELLKLYAVNSLEQQKAIRIKGAGPNGESVLQAMQYFVDETIDKEIWIKKVTNGIKDASELKTTGQVIRQMATIDAYRARLGLMQYKLLERIERLASIENLNNSK